MATSWWDSPTGQITQAATPGMLGAGVNWYANEQEKKQAAQRAAAAQGPQYNLAGQMQTEALNAAQATNPNEVAANQYGQWSNIVEPSFAKDVSATRGQLLARGQTGMGQENPGIAGYTPVAGQEVNPQLAALYAAQAGERSKAALGSLNQGRDYVTSLVTRAGNLGTMRGEALKTGQNAQPARTPSPMSGMLGSLSGMLGNKDLMGQIFKGFGPGQTPSPEQAASANANDQWDVLPQAQPWEVPQSDWAAGYDYQPSYDFGNYYGDWA